MPSHRPVFDHLLYVCKQSNTGCSEGLASFPGLFAFVACSTKFAQKTWAHSSHNTILLRMKDVIGCGFTLKEAQRDHTDGCVQA